MRMPRIKTPQNLAELNKAGLLYTRANDAWRKGRARSAFRLFISAARAGERSAIGTVAQFYDQGYGVSRNENVALRWYKLAYLNGDRSVANNIGCILRDRGKLDEALIWFRRSVRMNDGDANLNIAKLYLERKGDTARAVHYLIEARDSRWATDATKEEAMNLLERMQKRAPRRRKAGGMKRPATSKRHVRPDE